MIQSYTTREPRFEGENGHTFITDDEFDSIQYYEMIAYTQFGEHRYCCKHSDVLKKNTYIIDEHGYSMLRQLHKDRYKIIGVRVKSHAVMRLGRVEDKKRVLRDKNKFILHDYEFDYLIDNNTNSRKDFELKIDQIIKDVWR